MHNTYPTSFLSLDTSFHKVELLYENKTMNPIFSLQITNWQRKPDEQIIELKSLDTINSNEDIFALLEVVCE